MSYDISNADVKIMPGCHHTNEIVETQEQRRHSVHFTLAPHKLYFPKQNPCISQDKVYLSFQTNLSRLIFPYNSCCGGQRQSQVTQPQAATCVDLATCTCRQQSLLLPSYPCKAFFIPVDLCSLQSRPWLWYTLMQLAIISFECHPDAPKKSSCVEN